MTYMSMANKKSPEKKQKKKNMQGEQGLFINNV